QRPRDVGLDDLAGALVQAHGPHEPGPALHPHLGHVAVAAEHLDGPVGDPADHLGGHVLGHGRLLAAVGAGVEPGRQVVDEQASLGQLGQGVHDHPLHILVGPDTATERLPDLGVLEHPLVQVLGDPHGHGRDRDPAAVDPAHGRVEAIALLAQQGVVADPAVGEDQLGLVLVVHGPLAAADLEAGAVAVDQEAADTAAGPLAGVGDGEQDHVVGLGPVGDEGLAAVDYPAP